MIYLALGSNLGNRLSNLRYAVELIKRDILEDVYESIIIETKALLCSGAPQSWNRPYLNMIIVGKTSLSLEALHAKTMKIEEALGKNLRGTEKWAPRTIDIDILMYDELIVNTPKLTIPHPELLNRDFLIHLLGLMPHKYSTSIDINGLKMHTGQYAHDRLDITDLFSNALVLGPQVVGVLNVTPDSFSDGGKNFDPDEAVKHAHKLVQTGAEIIDIGAQSTKPGLGEFVGPEREYQRLKPVLEALENLDALISIDTYHPELIRILLEKHRVDWINDVSNSLEDDILQDIASSGCKILVVHSLSIPPTSETVLSHDLPVIDLIRVWAEKFIDRALRLGFSIDDIIIDPGIGFGKSIYQNIELLRGAEALKKIGVKILYGHSRKSFIRGFAQGFSPLERDLETICMSISLAQLGVDFVRIHNVQDHYRALVASRIAV